MNHFVCIISVFALHIILNTKPVFPICSPPMLVCNDTTCVFDANHPGGQWISSVIPMGTTSQIIGFTYSGLFTVKVYGRFITGAPCIISVGAACDSFIQTGSLIVSTLHGTGPGEYYYFHIVPVGGGQVYVNYLVYPNPCYADTNSLPCSDCIPSFNPKPDSSYIISGWIKDDNTTVNTTTYIHGSISISYGGSSHVSGAFHPKGQIIDGWQHLEDTFKIPHTATQISIHLNSGASSYFDDVRVYPYNGSMKSYVFDPLTLRLVAELDERNYATMYEYDEEGKLVRVKKETERGVMTIQESKSNTSK